MSDYANMKIADLKKELKSKGLPVSGNKQELIERLQAEAGTDLLDENDDDLDSDQDDQMTEEAIKAAEKELQKDTSFAEEPEPEKPRDQDTENKENSTLAAKSPEAVKAVVSPEDKIKARAERFGGFQSDDAKKAARAARFSDMLFATKSGTKAGKIGSEPAPDLDILKKRAERFGSAVSPLVKQAEVSEAIKRRQERFGIISKDEPKPKKIVMNSGTNSVIQEEKLKARAAKFNL
eukprot:TRINITY_DN3863_c0_g1_i1.p1 TRINITY_DN3863_c0_g1~~TRINITY_DN3863_c0_g1_i1.p1  ORF type:complete len:253 (-),score=56.34 TRINITY_DN3863_c0_g1_i1:213-920(-)